MNSGNIFTPFKEEDLLPKEEKLEVVHKGRKFTIGIPKETCLDERRTCITPDAVQVLVQNGHTIFVESGAGQGSFFTDLQYSESGATIVNSAAEAFQQDLVLKINPPTDNKIKNLRPLTYLVSALQINLRDRDYFLKKKKKKTL